MHPLDLLENVLATTGPAGIKRPLHVEAIQASITNRAEFAAVRRSWWAAHQVDLLDELDGDVAGVGDVEGALLPTGRVDDGEVHAIPPHGTGWEPGEPFLMFQERFKTALVNGGAPSSFAHGVVGSLNEMASNAIEHAEAVTVAPIATFEVSSDQWGFSVTDLGVGVLASLRRNPSYQTVKNDIAALQFAVTDGVSGTGRAGRGFGFTQVFRSLADRKCNIRFRTTGALATWEGVSPAAQRLKMTPMPSRTGFHVSVGGSLPLHRA